MLLASASPELAAVTVVVLVLLVASLLAMLPRRRLRLPFTVAVMLAGFLLGALIRAASDGAAQPAHPGVLADLAHLLDVGGSLSPALILFVLLPPLVFESAYALDARLLLKNLAPIALLAAPVLLLSTAITGAVVVAAGGREHGLDWTAALLFGALISATDPVAVVALFKDLGAPKRLGILVEGESLFNDGTAIVVFNILLALLVAGGGSTLSSSALHGLGQFVVVAAGGIGAGVALALGTFTLIGRVVSDERVEISLSVVLAYASFVVAEHFLHVSGVMATVSAGLIAGSHGKTKVSPSVQEFMHSFWEYMAFAMNSLIFFFVGLVIARQVSWTDVAMRADLIAATVAVVIGARALGVYGSVPLLRRWVEAIDLRYQTVMWWGGLRGAVSLALALTVFAHPGVPETTRTTVLVLAAAVVVFTLLVNALTMQPLIVHMGLDRPSPVDRFARAFAERERVDVADAVLRRLEREGAVLPSVLDGQREQLARRRGEAEQTLHALASEVRATPALSEAVAARVALSVEKREVLRRFGEGELTEGATRALLHSADHLLDQVKLGLDLPGERVVRPGAARLESRLLGACEPLPVLGRLARLLRARRLEEDVEATRGLYLVARAVGRTLTEIEERDAIPREALARVQTVYATWMFRAQGRLQRLTGEFPEYARCSQERLAELQTLRAEAKALHHLTEAGLVTDKARAEVERELHEREAALQQERAGAIELDPLTLLRSVPAFADADEDVLRALADRLVSRTFLEGEVVVEEGAPGASMFLIARGAVGVFTHDEQGQEVALSTLDAGGFFGEIAALLGGTRRASVRAVTPVNLLELDREALQAVLEEEPELARRVRASIYPRAVGRALVDCPGLAPLGPDERTDLAHQLEVERYADGATVQPAGEPHRLRYVCEGRVRVGEEVKGEGEVLGAEAFTGQPASVEAVAEGEVRLLAVPPAALETFRGRFPATHDACARAVSETAGRRA